MQPVNAQYRELIYFHVPVGEVKYFRVNENAIFRLKSEDRLTVHDGKINFLSDTLYEISGIRFHPDNLEWISSPPSKGQKFSRTFFGTVILAGGAALAAYGFSKFPNDDLKKEDRAQYHDESLTALSYMAGGIVIAAVSIPVFRIHPKRYSLSKNWRMKYQD